MPPAREREPVRRKLPLGVQSFRKLREDALLTGVTKFSKVNLFSGLNNLEDITLDPRFATICGYTQEELDTVFEPKLHAPDLKPLKRERVDTFLVGCLRAQADCAEGSQ